MYAVIKTGGKQYKIEKDQTIEVEKLEGKAGDKLTINEVLLINDNGKMTIGNPMISDAKVEAEVVDHHKDKKVTIFKMKRRQGYKKKQGHRQNITKIKIQSISKGN